MQIVISRRGQIVLPAKLRCQDDIKTGETFEVVRVRRGEYRLRREERPRNKGLIERLLACPEKGFFKPVRSGQTTDSIHPEFS